MIRRTVVKLPLCNARNMAESSRSRVKGKKYVTKKFGITPEYRYRFDPKFHYETGVSLDKMITEEEGRFLELMGSHPNPGESYATTEYVHDVNSILPGISVGPKFFDFKAGDTTMSGNEEAVKICNFLHLTPPMIKLHTEELKKLTKPAPTPPSHYIKQRVTNYLFPSPTIRHPGSREVSIEVDIEELNLDETTEQYLIELLEANKSKIDLKTLKHYHHYRLPKLMRMIPVTHELNGSILTITSDQCPTRNQNLSLCYYRLSGFLQEAQQLKPTSRTINIPKLYADFLFDGKEENEKAFEETNFVRVDRDGNGDVISLTGSKESIDNTVKILEDLIVDLVDEEYYISDSNVKHYVANFSTKAKQLLQEQEGYYSSNTDQIITFSDSIDNIRESLNQLINSLVQYEVSCPDHIKRFVLDKEFMTTCQDYNAYVRSATPDKIAVMAPNYEDEIFRAIITSRVADLQTNIVTNSIETTADVDWHRISEQFDVYVDDSDTSVTVSCFPDNMAELQFFLKQKEKRQ